MTTIKDIANRLGLSSATVSRALRNDETLAIPPETHSRILTTAEEMGYIRRARKSINKQEKMILIIHHHATFKNQIDSSYFFAIRSGIESQSSKLHLQCIFMSIEDFHITEKPVSGIILIGNYMVEEYYTILSSYKEIPVTVIGIVSHCRDIVDQVSYRNYDSVSLALNYLFEMGHKKIGYLGFYEAVGTEFFGSRITSFRNIMQIQGEINEDWIYEIRSNGELVESGYQLMNDIILKEQSMPSAYFCANDPVALGAIKALTDHGLRVPTDISIISHDGSYPTQYSIPALTAVDVHPFQLGVEGVKMLIERIEDVDSPAKQLLLYPTLIIRDSVSKL